MRAIARMLLLPFLLLWICMLSSIAIAQTYTPSGPLTYDGQSNLIIEGKEFTSGSNGIAIKLTNCQNVIIRNCYFHDFPSVIAVQIQNSSNVEVTGCEFDHFRTGVYAITSTQLNIHCNSFKDIGGTYPRGQIVQFNNCNGPGMRVNYNILDHTFGTGDPEDLINMYASGGTSNDRLQIIGNRLRGGGPSSSGGGIMVGDDDGHDIIVEDNILVDPGQYGIGVPAGYNITIRNNKIYGKQQSFTNVGMYVGLSGEIAAGHPCVANTIRVENNQVNWKRSDGVNNGFWNCGCCQGIINTGNNFNANIGPDILPTTLTLNDTECGSTSGGGTDSFDCTTSVPSGYDLVLCQNFETSQKAANYLGNDVWYFYDGGSPSSNNDPDLDNRFKIVQDPINSTNKAIELTKFNGDQDYSGQGLNPRTELSYRPSMERSVNEEVYFRIRTFFPANQANVFSAEFIQFWLHGAENIPLQIEVRNGKFGARIPRSPGYQTYFDNKNLSDYLNQWITWEVTADFNQNGGYWKVYMNGELVHTHTGGTATWPTSSGTWHPQYGAYANNGGSGTMQVLFDDLMIAEGSGGIVNPPTTSEITGIKLIDVSDESVIPAYQDLTTTDFIYKASISASEFNVYADITGTPDSVEFFHTYDGVVTRRKEGVSPYALRGDGTGYESWNLPNGEHSITIKVWKNGNQEDVETVEFTVSDDLVMVTPIDDAYLQGGTRYNTTDIRIENGNRVTYLKFDVTGISGSVNSAVLELTVSSDAGSGLLNVAGGNSNNWTENNITTSNAPASTGTIGSINTTYSLGQTYSIDLGNYITGNGTYSLVLTMGSGSNDVSFASSENSPAPKLIITTTEITVVDTDGDGTPDDIDGCPLDANKINAGTCGCGNVDADTDNDGYADCVDQCPNDPMKNDPGTCGCDVVDTDTDNDGHADCVDQCPNDPMKNEPMTCGCGVAEGTCQDCAGIPFGTATIDACGVCSGGTTGIDPSSPTIWYEDTDNDGVGDVNNSVESCDQPNGYVATSGDGCPSDGNKTVPGDCGCGVADTDTDNDGHADCYDQCPNDPMKNEPMTCGCGVAEGTCTNCDPIAEPSICYVDVNTTSGYNEIQWNAVNSVYLSEYLIYKESSVLGLYDQIGTTSELDFIDMTSNPDVQAARYKIAVRDNCGTETELSAAHKTIHLTINQGVGNNWNLIWDDYEGVTYSTIYIYRGSSSSNLVQIDAIAGDLTSYTDVNAPAGEVYYQVSIDAPNCAPTVGFKMSSNIAKSSVVNGMSDGLGTEILVYPNPTQGQVQIIGYSGDWVLKNQLGQVVSKGLNDYIEMSNLSSGVYHLVMGRKVIRIQKY